MTDTFIQGQTKENAQRLLFLNEEAGHDVSAVRAVSGGFEVEEDVAEAFAEAVKKDKADAAAARKAEADKKAADKKAADEAKAEADAAAAKAKSDEAAKAEAAKTTAAKTTTTTAKKE